MGQLFNTTNFLTNKKKDTKTAQLKIILNKQARSMVFERVESQPHPKNLDKKGQLFKIIEILIRGGGGT